MAKECGDRWEDRHHFKTKPTVGYGDITRFRRCAWLAAMEAMTGLLYVAFLSPGGFLYSSAKSENS